MSERRPTRYEGYFVDAQGVVWSTRRGDWHPLARHPDRDGYLKVQVWVDRHPVELRVHKAVAEAFHGPPPTPEHEVRHLDGDVLNNKASNLAWGTRLENAQDRERHGRTARGEKNGGGGKLRDKDVREIKALLREGLPQAKVAARFGVTQGMINHIHTGRQWGHVR